MKKIFLIAILFLFLNPQRVFAVECNSSGVTVVYVNGILTNDDEASLDRKKLQGEYEKRFGQTTTTFINGYNESHLAGGGDLYKSIQQTLEKAAATVVEDYDLKTILLQIHPEVTTQKILLVGHSQGTFYTNAIYRYFLEHGTSGESVAVYN